MLNTTTQFDNAITSPIREIKAQVEFYNGSTKIHTFTQNDRIIRFEIQRVGDYSRFFGFGITQRLNLKLIDVQRELSFTTANSIIVKLGARLADETIEYKNYPTFYISEVHRDENTNELSITAYDRTAEAAAHTVSELELETPYTIGEFITACGSLLGVECVGIDSAAFNVTYANGANFGGSETIREALTMAAEATQTIFYQSAANKLTFKALNTNSVLTIGKADYFTLDSGDNRRLQTICSVTELGDNVSSSTTAIGSTQYIRENAFYTMREDLGELLDAAIARIGNFTLAVCECKWRGNFALECGDRISIITKDNNSISLNVTDDTIEYDGSLKEKIKWSYDDESEETASNPSSIGDKLNQTFARVDKVNQNIQIITNKEADNDRKFSELYIDTNEIKGSVSALAANTTENVTQLQNQIVTLENSVAARITENELEVAINKVKSDGVQSITTATGFTFNDEGITISKTDAPTITNINEDGMRISANNNNVLTVKNDGVDAINLTAHNYLVIGKYSRLEDYGNRTGVFWIGG